MSNETKLFVPLLKKSFDVFYSAPVEAWGDFAANCELVYFKKNEIIKIQNSTDKNIR
jgi:hypothetical protein